jgi:DNA invertase Pin-like site-specific DNA recombinase
MSKTYFAYIRVSTVKQGERGSSLIEQKHAIEAYAARNALSVTRWFEEMETAAKQGRRQFAQMLAALRAGKANGLVIHKIDRSARNLRDWSDLGDLIDCGIDVRFVSDNFDLLSRGGRLSADIQAVVAADYIRNLREEVRKGLYGRLKQGIYPFAAPVGYLNTGKGTLKAIDPVKGPLIRHLFERYASNTVSLETLRHEIATKGLCAPSGRPLYPNTLSRILNNPFYGGVIRIRRSGESFAGAHEPLIPKAMFDRVQRILRGKTAPKATKHQHLLRRMVMCAHCGRRTLTPERQKSIVYYRCHGRACRGVAWRGDVLESIAREHIQRICLGEREMGDLRDLVADECSRRSADTEGLRRGNAMQLQRLDDRLARLTDLLIDQTIDRDSFNAHKQSMLLERQNLLTQMARLGGAPALRELFTEFERNNGQLLRYELLLDDERRELIEIVCSNFSAGANNATFTLRSPYKEMAEFDNLKECAHHRGDVRTRPLFDVLKTIAEKKSDGSPTRSSRPPSHPARWSAVNTGHLPEGRW